MPRKPENQFIKSVHDLMVVDAPYHAKTNNPFIAGIWDCWYSGTRADLWVEYKYVSLPKRATTLVLPDLSPLQLKWGAGRFMEGRNLAVIVGCKEGGVLLRHRQWEHPIPAEKFRASVMSRRDLAHWITSETMEASCLRPSPPSSK